MKTQASKFHLGVAPTGQARCRRCRQRISKGALRLVTTCFVKCGVSRRFFRCGACCDRKLANVVAGACGVVANLPVAAGVDPEAAASLNRRLASLSAPAASRIAIKDEGCAGEV